MHQTPFEVRDLLGHASITTTERYDNQKLENLQAAAARLESGKSFDPNAHANDARTNCQVFVKNPTECDADGVADRPSEIEVNSLDDQDLADWLAVRDDFRNWLIQAG